MATAVPTNKTLVQLRAQKKRWSETAVIENMWQFTNVPEV